MVGAQSIAKHAHFPFLAPAGLACSCIWGGRGGYSPVPTVHNLGTSPLGPGCLPVLLPLPPVLCCAVGLGATRPALHPAPLSHLGGRDAPGTRCPPQPRVDVAGVLEDSAVRTRGCGGWSSCGLSRCRSQPAAPHRAPHPPRRSRLPLRRGARVSAQRPPDATPSTTLIQTSVRARLLREL